MNHVQLTITHNNGDPVNFLLNDAQMQCYYTCDKKQDWIMFHIFADLEVIPCQYIKLYVYCDHRLLLSRLFHIKNKYIMLSAEYQNYKRLLGKTVT